MAKKKTGLSSTLFRGIDPYAQDTETGASPAATHLPLASIRPDPGQPRRVLPPALAEGLAAGALSPQEVLDGWQETAPDSPALRALQQLADSIARHGLINPITVRRPRADEDGPAGASYFVVTGERRYWAHVLLAAAGRPIQAGDLPQDPAHIRASIVDEGISIRAHQLIENIMREDINAVAKARGLWALRYELSGVHASRVNDSSPGEDEKEVNGKGEDGVNDSSPSAALVPWTRVAEELGISKRYRIFLTQVLTLSPEAQALVEEHGLAETAIRPIVQKLRDEPELQLAALQQLVAWQQENEDSGGPRRAITRGIDELVAQLLQQKDQAEAGPAVQRAAAAVDQEAQTRRFRRRVRGAIRFLHRLPRPEVTLLARDLALDSSYADVVDDMHALRDQLDELIRRIDDYRDEEQRARASDA
ncbi:MAG: ParB N-terminal domain-containing protein [Anaerolineae bacterium]|nr:ParB N-terminal domain-containing protein [Anaerolineae bacterium]